MSYIFKSNACCSLLNSENSEAPHLIAISSKMCFHLKSDAVALIALIVSLVALLISLLQVVQQYAATAYDYRRCSARTMGGWSKYTKRVFVPSEIRFEITFAVPHIELDIFSEGKKVLDYYIMI